MKTPIDVEIEKVCQAYPALTYEQFQQIIDDLIGKTQRSVTDKQLKQALNNVLKSRQP